MTQRGAQKFFICKSCGNIVGLIEGKGAPMACCDKPMEELMANTVDAAREKHVPAVTRTDVGIHVQVGEVPHPMTEEHAIEWIYVRTQKGGQRKNLLPGEPPTANFAFVEDDPLEVFAYCNLHGLWKAEL